MPRIVGWNPVFRQHILDNGQSISVDTYPDFNKGMEIEEVNGEWVRSAKPTEEACEA